MELIRTLNEMLHHFVWGPVMLAALSGIGIYFSMGTGFLQLRRFRTLYRNTLGSLFKTQERKAQKGTITPFQALSTALAGTLGTGNIVGVATALVAGGPGAVFWMILSAFFGMMTKYAEVVLAIHYRERNPKGDYVGGPMFYIRKGLGRHFSWLAGIFCLFCILASFGIGNMAQVNSMAGALQDAFQVPPHLVGIVTLALAAFVIIGGIKRIAKVTEKLVPLMSILFFLASLAVIVFHWRSIDDALSLIWHSAFRVRSVAGGVIGYTFSGAIRLGISRGVFSNEAGLGSAPIAHAAADTNSAVKQGMWGALEVFIDTIILCSVTALTILTSGVYNPIGKAANTLDGAALTNAAFATVFGNFGKYFIALAITFFAFATLIGWSYYGEKCVEFLARTRTLALTNLYRVIYVSMIFVGATAKLEVVWQLSDTLNGLMAIPNLIGIAALSPLVFRLTRQYFAQRTTPSALALRQWKP